MHANSFGGTCNWPLKGGARLIEVAATAGGTVHFKILQVLYFHTSFQYNLFLSGVKVKFIEDGKPKTILKKDFKSQIRPCSSS